MIPRIHVVLISTQAVPNIIPILDERFRPEQVIMLVSNDMLVNSKHLENIYKPRGIKVKCWPINDAWDVEHIRNRVMDLLMQYEHDSIVLNATGGTKLMSLAAYEAFRAVNKPIFYIHPEKDRLIWLYPGERAAADLADRIKLKEYLMAYGADTVIRLNKAGVPVALRELTNDIIANIAKYAPGLSSLNFYAAMADNNELRSPEISADMNNKHAFWQLVERFEQAGLLSRESKRLVFMHEAARFIVNGGWLELYAYACCLNLKQKLRIQDVSRSLEVTRRRGSHTIMNELDVALLRDNRLYLLECKTKRYSGNNKKHDEGAEVLYKLDSIRDLLGGIQARAMLVSFNKLKKHHRDRAKELHVEYCGHEDLRFLEEKLQHWISC